MRTKVYLALLGLLTVMLVVLATGQVAKAASITTTGLAGTDAQVTDRYGTVVKDPSTLSKWENYSIQYQWAIPDGESLAAGDTAPVTLPNGAVAASDLNFPLTDADGTTIGTFVIKAGETTGTITFNDELATKTIDRHGTLNFYAKGTAAGDTHFGWQLNKIGWIGSYDEQGKPSQLTWNVAFNPTGANLGTVVVTDTLGPNQTFLPTTVSAMAGQYDSAGSFISSGEPLTPQVIYQGNQVKFIFSNVTTAVNMVYNTQLENVTTNSNSWTNTASMQGTTVSGHVSWGGAGTGSGQGDGDDDEDATGSVVLNKKDATTGAVLPGASYDLRASDGTVIASDIQTNAKGKVFVDDLNPGTYSFVETKAPTGYDLNQTPIRFEITAGDLSTPVQVTQKDVERPTTGAVILTKTDATSGEKLAGATYDLQNQAGTVLKSGLTTDAQGQLEITGLSPADYMLVETQAPIGYDLSTTPLVFKIVAGQTAAVTVTAKDVKQLTEPSKPEVPGEPEEPGTPLEPGEPALPVVPGEPSEPEAPIKPGESETPVEPGLPMVPKEPVVPGEPVTPKEPSLPGTTTPKPTVPSVTLPGQPSTTVTVQDNTPVTTKPVKLPQTAEASHQVVWVMAIGLLLLFSLIGFGRWLVRRY
ncbi:hypothetical protein C5Z25_03575 [Lactobacillus sp. CBA3605]|uniref:SpaA isopeptide-forming pilin-related protein n=1 Tax=Lactobacillus sp. CBA3605 TaxID=2099788 RepID=UPI000CFC61E9|nr:SpaA isopeptide-forming pilin-related protein [Lactobacillus sp. CBA3605]AVK60887.1 hypothetical protein C5Z25_03575 [Lactobacillus sp. CBA3605]